MRLKATHYEVTGSKKEWTAHVFDGANLVTEISASSEKQAHFLAHQQYPDATNPIESDKELQRDYNSAAGRAYRAQNRK